MQPAHVDPYQVPKEFKMYHPIDSTSNMTTSDIIDRIFNNQKAYEARNAKKAQSEQKYYEQKQFVDEK